MDTDEVIKAKNAIFKGLDGLKNYYKSQKTFAEASKTPIMSVAEKVQW